MNLFSKIEEYMKNCGIAAALSAAPAVVCAFSGGADSSVLLRFLKYYCEKNRVPLYAAHFNHKIRGAEGDGDESFCRGICEDMGMGTVFFSDSCNIPETAKAKNLGLEECAREERYAFLVRIAGKIGEGTLIATAHNATDNMETVVFNMVRGAGIRGVSGISPVRGCFIRPLLSCTSEEIREFAKNEKIPFVIDSTNSDTDYTRNYIRREIVPRMRKINEKADESVLRLSESARRDCGYIDGIAEKIVGGEKYVPREKFISLETAVAARAVQLMFLRETGCLTNLSSKSIGDAVRLISSEQNGEISLPRRAKLCVHKDAVFVQTEKNHVTLPPESVNLPTDEAVEFGEYLIVVEKNDEKSKKIPSFYKMFTQQSFICGIISGKLSVRCRKEGDRYLINGINRKLKKYMCDNRVPQRIRDTLPVICDDDGILWVPSLRPRDGAAGKDTVISVYKKVDYEKDRTL